MPDVRGEYDFAFKKGALEQIMDRPKEPELIYLASPYTHPSSQMKQKRFEIVCSVASLMIKRGMMMFSPIAHSHPICQYGIDLSGEWEFWEKYDKSMLRKCTRMIVLMLEGWKESRGIAAETEYAKSLGMPIDYIDYDEWRPSEKDNNNHDQR